MELTVLVTCFSLFGFFQDVYCMHTMSQEFLTTPQQDLSGKLNNVVDPKNDYNRILFASPVSAINHHYRQNKEMPHVALRVLKPQDKTNEQHPVMHPKYSENTSPLITQGTKNTDSMNNNKTADNSKIKEHELKTELNDAGSIPERHEFKNNNHFKNKNNNVFHNLNEAKRENTHERINYRKKYEEYFTKPMKASSMEKSSSVSEEILKDKKYLNNSPSKCKADPNQISNEIEDSFNHLDVEAPISRSSKNNDDFIKPNLNSLKSSENEDMQKLVAEQIQTVNDIVNTAHDNAQRGQTSPSTKSHTRETAHHSPERHFSFLDSEDHTYDQSSKPRSFSPFVNDDEEDCRYIPVFDWPTRWFDPKTGNYYPAHPKLAGDGGTQNRQNTQQPAIKLNNDVAYMDKQNFVNQKYFSNVILPFTCQPDIQNVLTPTSFKCDDQYLDGPVFSNEPFTYNPETENVSPVSFQPNTAKDLLFTSCKPEIQDLKQPDCPSLVVPLADQEVSFQPEIQESDESVSPNMIQPLTYQLNIQNPNQCACPNAILPLRYQSAFQNSLAPASFKPEIQESNASPNVIQPLQHQLDLQNLNQLPYPNAESPEFLNLCMPASFEAKIQDLNQPTRPHEIQPLTDQSNIQNLNQRPFQNAFLPLGYQPDFQNSFEPKFQGLNLPSSPHVILPLPHLSDTQIAEDPLMYQPDNRNILPSTCWRPNIVLPSNVLTPYTHDLSQAPPTYQYTFEKELSDLHLTDVYNQNPDLQNSAINSENPIGNIVYNRPNPCNRPTTKYYGLPNQYNQFDAFPAYPVEENFQKRPYYIDNFRTPYVIGPSRLQNDDLYNQIKFPEYEKFNQQWKSIWNSQSKIL